MSVQIVKLRMTYWLVRFVRFRPVVLWTLFFVVNTVFANTSKGVCRFETHSLAFQGTAVEQARCLLTPVLKGGRLDTTHAELPLLFRNLVGRPAQIDLSKFKHYSSELGLDPNSFGGGVNLPLSRADSGNGPVAKYFVIHDTSYNVCADTGQLAKSDLSDAPWNRINTWTNNKNAHLYITRDGKLIAPQGRTFATAWRATKLENEIGLVSRGLFLHVENVQLRVAELKVGQSPKNADGNCRNDRIAQQPGLTDTQLSRLALTYIAASLRGGAWMIPAYHAVIDAGISDGHDDPQNFDLTQWGRHLCAHMDKLGAPCSN